MDYKIKPTLLREGSVLSMEDQNMLDSMYEDEGDGIWRTVAGDDPLDERRLARNAYTYKEWNSQTRSEKLLRLRKTRSQRLLPYLPKERSIKYIWLDAAIL